MNWDLILLSCDKLVLTKLHFQTQTMVRCEIHSNLKSGLFVISLSTGTKIATIECFPALFWCWALLRCLTLCTKAAASKNTSTTNCGREDITRSIEKVGMSIEGKCIICISKMCSETQTIPLESCLLRVCESGLNFDSWWYCVLK